MLIFNLTVSRCPTSQPNTDTVKLKISLYLPFYENIDSLITSKHLPRNRG